MTEKEKVIAPAFYTVRYVKRGRVAIVVQPSVDVDLVGKMVKGEQWRYALIEAWLPGKHDSDRHVQGYTIKVTPNKKASSVGHRA